MNDFFQAQLIKILDKRKDDLQASADRYLKAIEAGAIDSDMMLNFQAAHVRIDEVNNIVEWINGKIAL